MNKPKSDADGPEGWKCYDGCPVCKLMEKAAEENRELTGEEVEEAFKQAEKDAADQLH